MTIRRLVLTATVVAVVAAVALGAAAATAGRSHSGRSGSATSATVEGSVQPSTGQAAQASSAPPNTPGSTAQGQSSSSAPSWSDGGQAGEAAGDGSGPFTLVVSMASGEITTRVVPISVASREPVDPPHDTAEQWNTAVWVEQSTPPSTPGGGTTYVYGHACHYHTCPFTTLKDAQLGDHVSVATPTGTSMYTINRIGLSPKSAESLPPWASDSTAPNRIVLVTCAYEQGDTSTANIVVVAQLDP